MGIATIPSKFQDFTIAFYNGTDPIGTDNQPTSAGQALLDKFNVFLDSVPALEKDTDAKRNALYLTFLATNLVAGNMSGITNALSLDEVAARQTIFAVYSLCVQMLSALQGAMKTQSDVLNLYTQLQSNYTEMFSKIPIYGPTDTNHILADSTNFGATTLGYGNVSVQQVFNYLATSANLTPSSSVSWAPPLSTDPTFTNNNTKNLTSPISFTLSKTADGKFVAAVKILNFSGYSPMATLTSDTISPNPNLSGADQINDVVTKLMANLTDRWNTFVTQPNILSNGVYSIYPSTLARAWSANNEFPSYDVNNPPDSTGRGFWLYMISTGLWGPEPLAWPETMNSLQGWDTTAINTLRNQSYSYRSEVNAQLQLLLTAAKSRSDNLSAYAQQTQNVISQTQQSLQAQADLLKSLVDKLTAILSSLFK